jgi:hypothetical protein
MRRILTPARWKTSILVIGLLLLPLWMEGPLAPVTASGPVLDLRLGWNLALGDLEGAARVMVLKKDLEARREAPRAGQS